MFKVKIYTVGRSKEAWLQEALAEYEKRLSRSMEIEWVLAKDDADLAVKATLPWVALDRCGESLSSEMMSRKLKELLQAHGSRLHFLIGGAEGLSRELLRKSAAVWSLSALTFTHQMTRLILVEQLYRSLQIDQGSAYHK